MEEDKEFTRENIKIMLVEIRKYIERIEEMDKKIEAMYARWEEQHGKE